MNRITRASALTLAWLAAAVVPTSAAVTVYTDRAAFEVAIGPHVTYTFDTADGFPAAPAPIDSFGLVSASTFEPQGPAYLRPWPVDTDNQTLSANYDSIITLRLLIDLPAPTHAFGFDMYTGGDEGRVDVAFADGSTAIQYVPIAQAQNPRFFGLISDMPVMRILIQNAEGPRTQMNKGIDNLTIVPDPIQPLPVLGCIILLLRTPRIRKTDLARPEAESSNSMTISLAAPSCGDEKRGRT